jgi:protein-tyrosine phosphatase
VQIVLAHVDRYLGLQKRTVWDTMAQNGIMMQVNADSFTSFSTKRKVLGLLAEGMVQFVGSDCHNLTSRPPQIGKAFEVIRKKFGDNYIDQMQQYGYSLFATTK